jgi:hypothetical protein
MKRLSSVVCLALVCIALTSCNMGKTDGVEISIGESSKFSKEEIQSAVNCVIQEFRDFSGCTLTKIWYDEERSNMQIEDYMTYGTGSENRVKAEDVISLFSDFDVNSTGGDGGFNPDSTYTDWNWILVRDSKTGGWRAEEWGY